MHQNSQKKRILVIGPGESGIVNLEAVRSPPQCPMNPDDGKLIAAWEVMHWDCHCPPSGGKKHADTSTWLCFLEGQNCSHFAIAFGGRKFRILPHEGPYKSLLPVKGLKRKWLALVSLPIFLPSALCTHWTLAFPFHNKVGLWEPVAMQCYASYHVARYTFFAPHFVHDFYYIAGSVSESVRLLSNSTGLFCWLCGLLSHSVLHCFNLLQWWL